MKNSTFRNVFLCLSFLFFIGSLKSQQTLTQIGGWNAYVHLPANYSSTSVTYPTIVFFPGIGEVGTNAAALISNGPGAYITQGWNGNVVVDGNTVEFIVISLQPPSGYPNEATINQKLQTIKSLYRVNLNRLYLTGLSHGGWCSTTFVTGDAYGGPYTYASQIAAVVEVEGVIPDDNSPYPNLFDNYALSGGKLLGFEQANDNRGMPTRVNRMNATVPNSAIYVQTNFGGGGHCCWNQFYGGQGVQPGIFSLGGVSQNLYQWLARQSLGAPPPPPPPPPPNQSPTANAGTDITITLPLNSATLSGSGTDPDGTISGYSWVKLSGPAAGTLTNAGTSTATAGSLVAGTYSYQLTVTDNGGATDKDTINVIVNPAAAVNQSPTANAGSDITITLPIVTATLSGGGTDPDGTIAGYSWTKISGPAVGTLINTTTAIATAGSLVPGVYSYQLTVTDNAGATGKDTINVTVNPLAAVNQAPSANAGTDINITLPTNTATLTGSGTDADGTIAGYAWVKISGPAAGTLTNAGTSTATAGSLVAGTYSYQLTVTDNAGGTGKDTINVVVNPAAAVNQSPSANAGTDVNITLPTNTATLTGSGTDPDGTIAGYAWVKISGPAAGTLTNAGTSTATAGSLVAGTYSYQLTVTDNAGGTAKDTINVTVNAVANVSPTASAGTTQIITLPTNSVTLSGTASDADGSVATTVWSKLSGPASGTIASPNVLNTAVNGLVQGTYVFQFAVTDNLGATTNSNVTITVNAFVAAAGCNANAPVTYTLSTTQPGEIYITNGTSRGWKGGDTLKIPAGTYSVIEIDSFGGDPCRDLVIINSGGLVNVNGSMRFGKDVHHVKITGSGSAGITYGFKCNAFAFNRVNHYTMDRIEAGPNPGGVGIYGKQDPYVGQPWTQYPNYKSTKITINNCYVHDVAGEGMYIGHTYPAGDPANSNLIPQRQDSVTISNCTVANTGWDGIQLANARDGGLIFNNTVTNFGIADIDGQRAGIISGGNTNAQVYNNTITTGTGNGIQFFGYGIMQCYNNTITNVGNTIHHANGEENIYGIAALNTVETNPKQSMIIHDNQFNYPKGFGAIRFWDNGYSELVNLYNNKFCFATPPPANWQSLYIFLQPGFTNSNNVLSCTASPNMAPTANAGPDQSLTLPASTVTLTGSGTDPDGTIAGYSWTKLSGPAVTITAAGSATTTVTGLVAGTYQFRLTVTDNNGSTGSDIVIITVGAAANQVPVANAGSNLNITLPTNTVTLGGTGTDADGTITGYSWTKLSGPAATITTAGAATTTVTGLVAGTYQFRLTVTDNNGATGTDIITVTVSSAANQAPVADAGSNLNITLPTNTVTLNGSGTDADGSVVGYTWTKISGPAATITTAGAATTTVTGLVAGIYQFRLTVTDNNTATGTDIVTVTVNPAANQAPIAQAGTNQVITLPTNSVTLSGSGTDADGTISGYAWTKLSGPAASITTAGSATTTVTALVAGTYQFQLTVTDNNGATATDIVTIIVNAAAPGNQAPIANAGNNQVITLPVNTVTLSGSGTDADGTITGYGWTKLSGPSGSITAVSSSSTTVTGLTSGVYQFELTVTDNNGATGTDIIIVTVNGAANQAPIADAGSNINITLPTNSVTLNGSGIDPDGSITGYVWTKLSGPAATISSASSASTVVTGLVAGVYQFELEVTDNGGITAVDVVTVTVSAVANQLPIAYAGTNQNITLPANSVTLNGSGTDADGSVVSYAWAQLSGPAGNIVSAASASTSVTGLVMGVYVFQLTVTDNDGATATDIITITVNGAANAAPVANAGFDRSIALPSSNLVLDGSASFDPDGTIVSYSWVKISGPSPTTVVNSTSDKATIPTLFAGTYEFELTVTDNSGAMSTARVVINVLSASGNGLGNQKPIANAGSDASISIPAITSVMLDGSRSMDPDGTLVSYSWKVLSGPSTAAILSMSNVNTTVNNLMEEGNYLFELTVTDDKGESAKDTVRITTVNTLKVTQTVRLFPNPASDNMKIRFVSDKTGKMTMRIYDVFGRLVNTTTNLDKSATMYEKSINVSNLASGSYFLRLEFSDGDHVIEKFIKQ